MKTTAIEIRRIRVQELPGFVDAIDARGAAGGLVPISRQRALAQAQNPDADPDDVALLVAYHEGQCVGFFGILPGKRKAAGRLEKVYWASTWLVDERYRSMGVAFRLIREALSLGYTLFATELSEDAQTAYRGLGFAEFGPLVYYRMSMGTTRSLLSAPLRIARRALAAMRMNLRWADEQVRRADGLASSFRRTREYRRLTKGTHTALRDLRVETVGEPPDLIHVPRIPDDVGLEQRPFFQRGPAIVGWMMRCKWVLSRRDAEGDAGSYAFSDVRDSFTFVTANVYLRSTAEHLGFVILSLSEAEHRVVKVLDICESTRLTDLAILGIAVAAGRGIDAEVIVVPERVGRSLVVKACLEQEPELVTRPYFVLSADRTAAVTSGATETVLDYCDGDAAFT